MRYRQFGSTGLSVSEVGVGCSRLGGVFSGSSSKSDVQLLRAAVDAGINLFDTADMYAQGQSEVTVGKAIKGRRSAVVVATKGGYVVPPRSRWVSYARPALRPVVRVLRLRKRGSPPGPPTALTQSFTPEYLTRAVEASLRRLGTDYIDVYQLHSPPRAVVDSGEFVGALEALRSQGKIRYYGIAADDPDDVNDVARHPTIRSIQVPFSAIHQTASRRVFPDASANGVGVISRSCFAAGLLVGTLTEEELRRRTTDCDAIVNFRAHAIEIGRPLKELALQFSLGVEAISSTIIGMHTEEHLREALRCAAAPSLSEPEIAALQQQNFEGD